MSLTGNIEIPSTLIDAINGLADAAFLVSDDGLIWAVNSAACVMFEYSQSQLVGSQVDELMPKTARDYHHKVRNGAQSDRRVRQFSSGRAFECERRGGDRFQADVMLSPTEVDGVPMTWAIVQDLDRPTPLNASRQQALNTLDAIGHMAASTFDLSSDFPHVVSRIKEIVPHERISVMLISEEDPEMVEVAFLSGEVDSGYEQGALLPLQNSSTDWIVKARAVTSFTARNAKYAPASMRAGFKQGITEGCGAPLFDGDEVIGMLALGTKNPGGFTEFQRTLIERLANHLSVAVVNQRNRARLVSQSNELEAIGEITKIVSSSPDLDSAFNAASESIARRVPFDRLSVYSVDLEKGSITGMFSAGETLPGFDMSTHQLPEGTVQSFQEMFTHGHPTVFDRERIAQAAESQPSFIPYRNAGYKWALIVPLIVTQRAVGFISFGCKSKEGYTDSEIASAMQIGEQLAGPVANAFQRDRLAKEFEVETTLIEIGSVIGSTLDLKSSKDQLGPLMRSLIDSNSVIISSVTEDGQNLRIFYMDYASIGPEHDFEEGTVHTLIGTTAEQIIQSRRPMIVNTETGEEFAAKFSGSGSAHADGGLISVMNVPLIANDVIFGFLTFRSVVPHAYSEADIEVAEKIANQLASSVAFSELRLRDSQLEDERSTLVTIGGLMGSATDLSDVWAEFADKLADLVEFDYVSLVRIDAEARIVESLFHTSVLGNRGYGRASGDTYPLKGTLAESLLSAGQGQIFAFDSPESWRGEYPGSRPATADNQVRTVLGVPLIWGGSTVAVLFIHSLEHNAYIPSQLRLVERVAAQIAGPVAGGFLRRKEAELAFEREILTKIGSVMGSVTDLDDAWPTVVDLIDEVIECHRINLVSIDHSSSKATVVYDSWNYGEHAQLSRLGSTYDLAGSVAGRVIETASGQIVNAELANELREQFPGSLNHDRNLSTVSNIGIPLIWGGDVVAALFIGHFVVGNYDHTDLELGIRIAAQIAGPVAGSILRETEARLTRDRELLATIGSLMSAAIDLDQVWIEFSDLVSGAVAFDRLDLVSIDKANSRALVVHDRWVSEQILELPSTGASYELSGSVAEHVAQTGQSFEFSHENPNQLRTKFPNAFRPGVKYPFLSNIAIPLTWGGEVVAVLFFCEVENNAYGIQHIEMAERIAAQIAGPVAGNLLRQRESELAQERILRETAELKVTTLSELSETKSNFVSAMSHELRTPLTSIVAFADIMSRNAQIEISGRGPEHLKVIQRNARRLEGMIDELLDLSRMESGRFEIFRSSFDFVSMIHECLESAGPQFQSLSQKVHCEIEDEVLPVNGDRGRLMQVVNNLLSNASKFSPEGTEIDLVVAEKNDWLTLEVRDRGPGVPEEKPEELFEMFHRADNELTRRVPGTGIGLHISKRIIDEHGGEITLDTRKDGPGTIAAFRIPTVVTFLS